MAIEPWREEQISEFRRRYVAGRVLQFVPAFSVLLCLAAVVNPKLVGFFVAQVAFLLWFIAFMSKRRALRLTGDDGDSAVSHLLPLAGVILAVAVIRSLFKGDWRWVIVVGAIGGLIAVGIGLRWMVYDRWLRRGQSLASSM